jgi:hypothetical protein
MMGKIGENIYFLNRKKTHQAVYSEHRLQCVKIHLGERSTTAGLLGRSLGALVIRSIFATPFSPLSAALFNPPTAIYQE